MLTSEQDLARRLIFIILLMANAGLYLAWPWLRSLPLLSDSAERYEINRDSVTRNEQYLKWFSKLIRVEQAVLYLGTSESTTPYNLAAQLNQLAPGNPPLIRHAKAGLSPIHTAVLISKWEREGIEIPPIVLAVNPVYFTRAYDLVNDGWLSGIVRSPIFLQMNHREVRENLSQEVQDIYDQHFLLRRMLYPVNAQEYLGNLVYLVFHQARKEPDAVHFRVPSYEFDGKLPDYDEAKNVWKTKLAPDRFNKTRWLVREPKNSVNLKGLASTIAILRDKRPPVLILIFPVNRKFYEFHGLGMTEWDRTYEDIRGQIRRFSQGENIYLIDLFDNPKLHLGFKDRMHLDQYGFFQLGRFLTKSLEYKRYVAAVREYYEEADRTKHVQKAG